MLFINARKLASLIPNSRKQKQFSDEEIQSIANDNWRGTKWGDGDYEDIPGFCQSASLDEIEAHDYVLTPVTTSVLRRPRPKACLSRSDSQN